MISPKPLKNRLLIDCCNGDRTFCEYDVKSAVEFWYEYRDEPIKFFDNFRDEFENFLVDELGYIRDSDAFIYVDEYYIDDECKEDFNIWLFRYTFADVI